MLESATSINRSQFAPPPAPLPGSVWWSKLTSALSQWAMAEVERMRQSDCGFHAMVVNKAGTSTLALKQFLHIEWLVFGICLWASADILDDWQDSLLDSFSWLAFLLWISPVFVEVTRRAKQPEFRNAVLLSWIGLGMSMLGSFGVLPSFRYHGLAFAVAGLLPWSWRSVTWLVFSATWTPVFGLIWSDAGAATIAASRVVGAILAAALAMQVQSNSSLDTFEAEPPPSK